MKQQSIEELERELDALSPKQAKETLEGVEVQATEEAKPEEYLVFTKYPITDDERKCFDRAVLDYNRRRHAVTGDPNPDDPEGFVAMDRKVQRMLRHIHR